MIQIIIIEDHSTTQLQNEGNRYLRNTTNKIIDIKYSCDKYVPYQNQYAVQ